MLTTHIKFMHWARNNEFVIHMKHKGAITSGIFISDTKATQLISLK